MGLFDENKIAEDVLIPIFSEIYDFKNLINLNANEENFEGLDLGDWAARTAFQITSKSDNKKVKKTLQSVVNKKYYEDFDTIIIYDITTKQRSYSGSGWAKIIIGRFGFDKSNIRDYTDLLSEIKNLPLEKIQKIADILESQFSESTQTGRISEPNFTELKESCRKITAAAVKQTLYGRQMIRREAFRAGAEHFLNSVVRYSFVAGASAVGKSTVLASQAEAMQADGWTTLMFRLLPERGFSLEYAKEHFYCQNN